MNEMIDRIVDILMSRGCGNSDQCEQDSRAIIEAMRDPTEVMFLARPVSCPDRKKWEQWWGWQIDAMLTESKIFSKP